MAHETVIDMLCDTYHLSKIDAESFYINWWLTRNRSQELPEGRIAKQSIAQNALSFISLDVFHKNRQSSLKDLVKLSKLEFKKLCPDIPFNGFEASNLLFSCQRFPKI